jgi:hypothetical protein
VRLKEFRPTLEAAHSGTRKARGICSIYAVGSVKEETVRATTAPSLPLSPHHHIRVDSKTGIQVLRKYLTPELNWLFHESTKAWFLISVNILQHNAALFKTGSNPRSQIFIWLLVEGDEAFR